MMGKINNVLKARRDWYKILMLNLEIGEGMDYLHKFIWNGKHFIIDIASGSVHLCDKVLYDLLSETEKPNQNVWHEKYGGRYGASEIEEALEEAMALMEEGLLYAEDTFSSLQNSISQDVIKAMCLHVAHACNLKCTYCFASQGEYKGKAALMDLETGKKALDFLVAHSKQRRQLEVDFFGGEPLLNWDVVKSLVQYGRKLEQKHHKIFRFTITTNGMLLDDEKIDFINEHMENVVLSLDGRKAVNDQMRPGHFGESSYDEIVPKFKRLIQRRKKGTYYIRGTFTRNNLDFTEDVQHYYDLGFDITSLEPVVADPKEAYAIQKEDIPHILAEYDKLAERYISLKRKNPKFSFYHFVMNMNEGPCVARKISGCGAGNNYVSVTPTGDIYPCHQFVDNPDFKIGDLSHGIQNKDLVERFRCVNIYTKETCQGCWARFYCSGGCMASAYHQHGDFNQPDEIGCEMEKKRVECGIAIFEALQEGS